VESFPEKCYCREVEKENPANRGYIKYKLKDESFKNRRDVLVFVAQLIPKLKTRQNPGKPAPAEAAKPSTSSAAPSQPTSQPSGGSGGGGGGNKNKKKGRR